MPTKVSTSGSRTVEELERELAEAHRREAATADVLKVISRSAFDLQAVLDALVESAAKLCGGDDVSIFRFDADTLSRVAHCGPVRGPIGYVIPAISGSVAGRSVLERRPIHVADLQTETQDYPEGSAMARELGHRTILVVPLLREGVPLGVISLRRNEVEPFSDKQIELVTTFADQAVIAIENTRLFEAEQASKRELQEALEYQTATSEVLNVISRSPTELQPVLDAIAATAARLCESMDATVWRVAGGRVRVAAQFGSPTNSSSLPLTRGSVTGRAIVDRKTIHVHDLAAMVETEYPDVKEIQQRVGHRTTLVTPLLSQGEALGAISVRKIQVHPFSDRQIALLQTFADQAVIAIENARLFEEVQARTRELQESLEFQTASSDVLNVISRSPSQLQPVVDAIVQTAKRLCSAERANIWRLRAGKFDLLAHTVTDPALVKYLVENPIPAGRDSIAGRAVLEGRTIHVPDISADPELSGQKQIQRSSNRTMLVVPLLREGEPIGVISLARTEVEPFTDKQIDLVTTFADQAVIAIENARLFEEVQARTRELQESLEHQTATSDVLDVISRSPSQLQPVLDSIVETAKRLCNARRAVIWRLNDGAFRLAAHTSTTDPDHARFLVENPVGTDSVAGRAAMQARTVHLHDASADASLGDQRQRQVGGARTMLGVPLLRNGTPIGVIVLSRTEVHPFTDKQVDLVTTFADQAVIAIENTRLFEEVQARTRELQESLEYQTATSDVLNVISRAPSQLQPVFDAIVSTARRLCQADNAFVYTLDGGTYRLATSDRAEEEYVKFLRDNPIAPGRGTLVGRVSLEQRTIHLPDATAAPEYDWAESPKRGNFRTMLGVPLIRGGVVIGVIAMVRRAVNPFSDKQVDLVTTFADQALIAIENVRLFEEVQARTRELARSVEELKSLGEVSQTVNSSLALEKVLPAILEHACAISYASGGAIYEFYKASGEFHLAAGHNMTDQHIARVRAQPSRLGDPVVGECGERREAVQIADLTAAPSSPLLDILLRTGVRAILAVPLMHQGEVIGALVVRRNHPGAFSAEIIQLLEAFAAQSAIAVHNARLFEEIAQKSRELEIASQHKSQFVANMSHELRTPLAAILGYAELMQEGFYEAQGEKSMAALTRIRSNGKHLLGLINTVLDIAKIESGQFSLSLSEYSLDSVVETVRVATESLAETKKLALKTEVAKRLPVGLGDEQRLTQVLLNLVGNAIKFTDTGEVRITATAVDGHFTVGVTDTGPGIPPEELKRVFEQFHQIDNSNTKAKGGTGLGLAIAKQIVEMHGGRIWVESTLGKGATFQMELPVRAEFQKSTPAS